MSRLKLFELPSALEPRIRSSEPNRWFSIWIMLSLRDDATQLFELSFLISYPSCAIIMLRLFCHSLLSSGLYGAEPLCLGCVSPAFLSNRSEPRSGLELEEEEFWSAVDCSFRRMYSWRTRIVSFAGRCRVIVFCSELSFSIPM